jgi:tRNA threonylcarbamoyladenosine biosynthesis protein TsaE
VSERDCLVLQSKSSSETKRIGARVGKLLLAGDVLLLQGELGSGKTTLTQGIGGALAVAGPVKSSSFVLMNEYHGRLTVYHADLYRLNDPAEVAGLALEEVAAEGVLVVEWPERAWRELPPEHLLVRLEEKSARERMITIAARGKRYEEILSALNTRSKRQ